MAFIDLGKPGDITEAVVGQGATEFAEKLRLEAEDPEHQELHEAQKRLHVENPSEYLGMTEEEALEARLHKSAGHVALQETIES